MEQESFTAFADVYDAYMDGIPYDDWYAYLQSLLDEYGIEKGSLVADLGCGTGNMTERLAGAGYDMIGLDASDEMLSVAMDKQMERGSNILYIRQDVTEMELYGTVAAMVSVGDSMNYLLEEEDLKKVFQGANTYLDAGGYFIFDLKTDAYYKNELGSQTFVEQKQDGTLIWENEYDDTKMLHKYDLTIYKRAKGEYYERRYERQYQRAYPLKRLEALVREAGMEFVAAYDAFTKKAPDKDGNRIYVVAKEKGKGKT